MRVFFLSAAENKKEDPHPTLSRKRERAQKGIALAAFGMAQIAPGLGAAFAALTSTLWTAYSVSRQRRLGRNR